MRKIPTLFERDQKTGRIGPTVTPGCEWVLDGFGIATRKWDGTCCLIQQGELWKRYDAKPGRTAPPHFEMAQPEPDPITGHWPGWVPVGDGPEDRWHREAFAQPFREFIDGTYELCGPAINGNPDGFDVHVLVDHLSTKIHLCRLDFEGLRDSLADGAIEGYVWRHRLDGRMAKIKAKDFGIKRCAKRSGV